MKTLGFALALSVAVSSSFAQAPGTFNWPGGSGSWTSAGWSTGADHAIPNLAGDTVRIGPTATVTLDTDITVGTINLTNKTTIVSDGTARTLTLDSGSSSTAATITGCSINWQSEKDSYIGTTPVDNTLVLSLASPLNVTLQNNSTQPKLIIPAKITGGSAEAPLDIAFRWRHSWGNGVLFLTNPGNDFHGDLHIYRDGTRDGDYSSVSCGGDGSSFNDSMLGDAANKVWLHAAANTSLVDLFLGLHGCSASKPLNRHVLGSGAVRGFNNFLTWTQEASVYLGPSCVIDPGLSASAAGTIVLKGTSVNMDAGTKLRLTVGASYHDTVQFDVSKALAFNGAIEFEEGTGYADIEGGTTINLVTVSTVAFTFTPSSTPAGWSFSVAGSASEGWTVSATKLADYAQATVQDATLIGDTFATANAFVVMPAGGAVPTTLRCYYGTTDGGENPAAWDAYADYPGTVTEEMTVSVPLTGLTLNGTYVYRFAATSNGRTAISTTLASFTTRPLTTNDTFTWATTSGDWHGDNWTITTPYARKVPYVAGDTIVFDLDGGATTSQLTNDVSVGFVNLRLDGGYGTRAKIVANERPATLTLDPGAQAEQVRITGTSHHNGLEFGTTAAGSALTVALAAPLDLYCDNNCGGLKIYAYAPIAGGSAEAPTPIYLNHVGNEWRDLWLCLDNEGNSFVGDIYVGTTRDENSVKGSSYLWVGASTLRTDAVLGPATNRVVLRNRSFLTYTAFSWLSGNHTAVCNRWIVGNGTVRCSEREQATPTDSQYYALALSALARIEPCSADETGYGTITFRAKSFSTDPATTFSLDVAPDGSANDAIAIATATNDIVLNGTLTVRSPAHVPTGTQFTVLTVENTAAGFTNALSRVPGYSMTTVGDAENGWSVILTKNFDGTIFLIR